MQKKYLRACDSMQGSTNVYPPSHLAIYKTCYTKVHRHTCAPTYTKVHGQFFRRNGEVSQVARCGRWALTLSAISDSWKLIQERCLWIFLPVKFFVQFRICVSQFA